MLALFLFTHLLLFPTIVVFAMLHNINVRYYLIVPLALYVADRILRFAYGRRRAEIVSMWLLSDSADSHSVDAALQSNKLRVVRLDVVVHGSRWLSLFQPQPGQ